MPISVKAPGREHPVRGTAIRSIYPWADLSAGDWFFIPHDYENPRESHRSVTAIQGKIGQLIRERRADGDKHKYMHFRADNNGKPGVKVMRVR